MFKKYLYIACDVPGTRFWEYSLGQSIVAPFLLEFIVSGGCRCDQTTRALPDKCRYTSFAELWSRHCDVPAAATAAPGCAHGKPAERFLKTACTVTDLILGQPYEVCAVSPFNYEEIEPQGHVVGRVLACGGGSPFSPHLLFPCSPGESLLACLCCTPRPLPRGIWGCVLTIEKFCMLKKLGPHL